MSYSPLSSIKWLRLSVLVSALALAFAPAPVFADLMLFPTRVVLEDGARSAQVELINRDATAVSYKISLINRRMTDTGEIVEAKEPVEGETFADDMIFFTPRLVTLEPGSSQIVRIAVRKPPALATGEYRTHLQFDRLPDIEESSDIEQLRPDGTGTTSSFRLTALIGASIPVIVRHGPTAASVQIASLALELSENKNEQALTFTIQRIGNRSTYGDIVALLEQPGQKPVTLATVGGVAVYFPNAERRAKLQFTVPPGTRLQGGRIILRYQGSQDSGGGLIAQSEIGLP